MKENKAVYELSLKLDELNVDVQKITTLLLDIVRDDKDWWKANMCMLASQSLNSLKEHLRALNDVSLTKWDFDVSEEFSCSVLDPIESITWLAALCRLDHILIGSLPRRFVDEFELQWRIMALHWVG